MTEAAGKRKRRPILTVILVLTGLVLASVAAHRLVPPPVTFLMVTRAIEGEGLSYRWKSLDDISPRLVEAVIASEDARFCSHRGFDMEAIEKALKANEQGGRIRGGSTISQQTAKNVFLWPGRDWIRKGLEAGYTVLIETLWGKRRIMEVYLNVAEWAPGVYGAEAASRHWFGKSAADLTPPRGGAAGGPPAVASPVQCVLARPLRPPSRLPRAGRDGHGPQRASRRLRAGLTVKLDLTAPLASLCAPKRRVSRPTPERPGRTP